MVPSQNLLDQFLAESPGQWARELAIARMNDHGITPINWTAVAVELQRDWSLPTGQDMGRVFHDHYHSYGLLMDSFESVTANLAKKAS